MNEPTVEEIAIMAARIYAPAQSSIGYKAAVRAAIKIWDQAIQQLEDRKRDNEKESSNA